MNDHACMRRGAPLALCKQNEIKSERARSALFRTRSRGLYGTRQLGLDPSVGVFLVWWGNLHKFPCVMVKRGKGAF